MEKRKIYFIAPIANVDSSILKISLEHDFKIKDIGIWNYCEILSKIERISPQGISSNLMKNYPVLLDFERQKIYIIENSFEVKKSDNSIAQEEILSFESQKFQSELVQNYLYYTIKKLRLFKEGNIFIPFWHLYSKKDNVLNPFMAYSYSLHSDILSEKYSIIDDNELLELNKFLKKIKLPFKYSFLQLAFENFELSYHVINQNLAFLSLMISLESLFHPSDYGELSYRISRNVAVLLGNVINDDSKHIQLKIKNLYNKRSKIVHRGNKDIIDNNDLLELRQYVRDSIKMVNKINKNKDNLLDLLNSSGFNDKKQMKKHPLEKIS